MSRSTVEENQTIGWNQVKKIPIEIYFFILSIAAQLFSLLSQYEKAPSTVRSDFYSFLYNRSRMKTLTNYFTTTTKDPDEEKSIDTTKNSLENVEKSTNSYRWPSGSRTTEEEDRIFDMLEKSIDNALIESVDSNKLKEAARNPADSNNERICGETETAVTENYDKNSDEKEQKKTLWEAMRDRESRKISGMRRTRGLDLIAKSQITQPMDVDSMQEGSGVAVKQSPDKNSRLSSPSSSVVNSRAKRNSPSGKRNQSKIVDFFPRKIS